jgi:hypothetical protein
MVVTNGGLMKQIPKQKWILSTLLVAALGSQYYFSISSKNLGAFDLSSEAVPPEVQALKDFTAAMERVTPPAAAPVAAPAPAVTQAAAPAAPCGDCVILTKAEALNMRKVLEEVAGKKSQDSQVEEETPREKRLRLKEEAKEAREEEKQRKKDEAQAKIDKLREEKDARNDEFKEKMEAVVEKCEEKITCLTSGYTSLLARYTGKKKIDNSVAQSVYRLHIEKVLEASMSDESKSEAVAEALASLAGDVPKDYRQVKESAILSVKKAVSDTAISANTSFRLSEQLLRAGRVSESISASSQAETDATNATGMANKYTSTISQSLKEISDSVSLTFMNKKTLEVQRLLMNMRNTTGPALKDIDTDSTNPLIDLNPRTRGVVRGGGVRGSDDRNPNFGTRNSDLPNIPFGSIPAPRGFRGAYPQ